MINNTPNIDFKKDLFVCVDVDGTLLDMNTPLQHFLAKKGLSFDPSKIESYDFKGNIGCDRKCIFDCFDKGAFFTYQSNFPICDIDNVRKGIEEVGAIPMIYSLVTDSEGIPEFRKEFFESKGFEVMLFEKEKPVFLNAIALIDDCIENHERWIKEGYEGLLFLVDAPWNQEKFYQESLVWGRVQRVSSAEEAVEYIAEYLKGKDMDLE